MNFPKGVKGGEIACLLSIIILSFLYRYWHLGSLGWEEAGKSSILGMRFFSGSVLHFSDADYYALIADDFLSGKGMNIPFPPPFTIWALIAFQSLFGHDIFILKICYAVIGSLSILFIYLTARELLDKKTALITAFLCSVSFTLIFITGGLNTENIYLFTSSLSTFCFIFLYRERSIAARHYIIFSFFFGCTAAIAVLSRSEFLLAVFIFFMFGLFKKEWVPARKIKIFTAAFLGFILLITPWTVRNYFFMKELNKAYPQANLPTFVPVALNGPFNFLEGHHQKATGTYAPYFSERLEDGAVLNLTPDNGSHLAMVRDGYRLGWKHIKENLPMELSLLPKKAGIFLNGFSNGFFLNNFPAGLEGEIPNKADSFVPKNKVALSLALLLFLYGFYQLTKMKDKGAIRYLPLLLLLIPFFVSIIFYALSRMVYPFLPFFYMVLSTGVVALLKGVGPEKKSAGKACILVVIVLILFGFLSSREFTLLEKKRSGQLGRFEITLKNLQ